MKLGEKAESSSTDVIRLARDSRGVYQLLDDELVSADELSDEESFPKYGDFLPVEIVSGGPELELMGDGDHYVECPADLAQRLVNFDIEIGDEFEIESVRKNGQGNWVYTVSLKD